MKTLPHIESSNFDSGSSRQKSVESEEKQVIQILEEACKQYEKYVELNSYPKLHEQNDLEDYSKRDATHPLTIVAIS